MRRKRARLLHRRLQSRHHAPHRAHRRTARGIHTARGERLQRLQSRPAHPLGLLRRRLHARIPRPRSVVRRPGRAGDHRTRGIPPPRRQDAELPQRLRSRRYGGHKQQHHPEERRRTGHPVGSEPPGETGPGDRPKIRSDDHSRRRDHPRTDRLRPLQRPFHHGQQLPLRHRRPAIAPQRQGAGGAGDAQPSGLAAQEPRTPRVRSQSLRRRADRRHRNYERRRVLPQSHRTRPRPQTVRVGEYRHPRCDGRDLPASGPQPQHDADLRPEQLARSAARGTRR